MKKLLLSLTVFLLAGMLAAFSFVPVGAITRRAQTTPQATPQPSAEPSVVVIPEAANPADSIEFNRLGVQQDVFLQGPLDSTTLRFSLPVEWQLKEGAQLQLEFASYLSNLIIAQEVPNLEGAIAGRLEVSLNGVPLEKIVVSGSGEHSATLDIPSEALMSEPYELTLQWDASASCESNLVSSLALHASSLLVLPHNEVDMPLDLSNYPQPLYQAGNPFQQMIKIVVPDQPLVEEIQAALAIAGSFGRMTGGEVEPMLVPASVVDMLSSVSHFIVVGRSDQFGFLDTAALAEIPNAGSGLIQILPGLHSNSTAIVVVTGADGAAVLKAATALSSGNMLVGAEKDRAFVTELAAVSEQSFDQDQTFADLNQNELTFKDFGSTKADVNFYIPSGTSIGPEAYLDLAFNHSQLIDYLRSGIVVRINDTPIGSVRLSDTTSNLNSVRIIVPASSLQAGSNRLEIQVDLTARNICSDPRQGSLWVTIFPESLLHLPVVTQAASEIIPAALGNFPWPYTSAPLDATTVYLPVDDSAAWMAAARLAFALGSNDSGGTQALQVAFTETGSVINPENGNAILIGTIQKLPLLVGLQGVIPATFDVSGALAAEVQTQLGFQVDPAQSLGFLELAPAAVTPDKALMAVLGSDSVGLDSAVNALLSSAMRRKLLDSNFAVVQEKRITALQVTAVPAESVPVIPGATGMPAMSATQAASGEPVVTAARRDGWVMPVMVLSALVALGLLLFEGYKAFFKRK